VITLSTIAKITILLVLIIFIIAKSKHCTYFHSYYCIYLC